MEVLCATALAGSLLGSILVAQGAHLRQIRDAEQQQTAVQLLHRMLERWTASRHGIPEDGDHPMPESADWICRVARIDAPDAIVLQARIARIELWNANPVGRGRKAAASVEMLVPETREQSR